MYVIYQTAIAGKQSTGATELAICTFAAWAQGEIAAHLASIGFAGLVPYAPAPLEELVVKLDAAGEELLRYNAGVAPLLLETVGDDTGELVSSITSFTDGQWTLTKTYQPRVQQFRLQVSPVEFKMLFQPAERLAIRQAREYAGDDGGLKTLALLVDDWWSILDDPRLISVDLALPQTQAGLDMLVPAGILTEERRAEIGLGMPMA